jgi:hypothetical protein
MLVTQKFSYPYRRLMLGNPQPKGTHTVAGVWVCLSHMAVGVPGSAVSGWIVRPAAQAGRPCSTHVPAGSMHEYHSHRHETGYEAGSTPQWLGTQLLTIFLCMLPQIP